MGRIGIRNDRACTGATVSLRLLVVGLCLAASHPAWTSEPSRLALTKAAFVLNFGRYTEWPADTFATPESPLHLCLLKDNSEIGIAMRRAEGKRIGSRPLVVRRIASSDELPGCHMFFAEAGALALDAQWWQALSQSAVLSIGDAPDFTGQGGVIGLVPVDLRLGFEVNLAAARRLEIRLSSQLLALARAVKGS